MMFAPRVNKSQQESKKYMYQIKKQRTKKHSIVFKELVLIFASDN